MQRKWHALCMCASPEPFVRAKRSRIGIMQSEQCDGFCPVQRGWVALADSEGNEF